MKHVILTIVLLLASGLVIAQTKMSDQLSKTTRMNTQSEIYFAGGCFWGTEHFMKQIDGVTNTRVGYANGKMSIKNPTYEQVCNDNTGFAETVEVSYDPRQADLKLLIEKYQPARQRYRITVSYRHLLYEYGRSADHQRDRGGIGQELYQAHRRRDSAIK